MTDGLLGNYSNNGFPEIHRLIQRINDAPKWPVSSTNDKTQATRLHRRLRPGVTAELVAAYRTGTPTNELCRRSSVSKVGALKSAGQSRRRMGHQPMSQYEIDRAVQLYAEAELPIRTIATKSGKSKCRVRQVLHE